MDLWPPQLLRCWPKSNGGGEKKGALSFEKTPHFHTKIVVGVLVVFAFDKPGVVIEDESYIATNKIIRKPVTSGASTDIQAYLQPADIALDDKR